MVLEAMKMEHSIAAPMDGKIERVFYKAGDLVDEGAELIAFAEDA
jgi:3-methylcrotonyl-CoA carboxylase alpha subunit